MTAPKDALVLPDGAAMLQPVAPPRASQSLATQLVAMAKDDALDITKLESLMRMQREMEAEEKRTAFRAARARLQAKLPQIAKSGVIDRGERGGKSRYARLEDIDHQIRPLLAEEGFSLAFDSQPVQGGTIFTCELSHCDGHAETRTLMLPTDSGAGRNAVQSMGSTVSYARRYLIEMHLNLVKRDEDDDGNGGSPSLTDEQIATLKRELAEAGGNEARLLKMYGGDWKLITQAQFKAVRQAIADAARARAAKGGGQ